MVSQSALSLLPAIGYALLAALACWLVYRVVVARRRRDGTASTSAALPNPVGVGSATRSAFSFARARARTGWDWHGWSLPWPRVPWSKSASKSGTSNSGKSNAKNLSVELLPTTGLPPHPASTPTPTGPLVDLTPPTPPLIPSTSASVGPISPRTPSPSHYFAYRGIRSPSPHALLATTSPSKHKRSRSLGGVPVRRLSGGNSGLRNKVHFDSELEMREFHTRGTSREGLLIDFSSSSSGSSSGSYPGTGTSSGRTSSESEDEKTRISPAASDIGVLKLPGPSPSSPFSSSSSNATTMPMSKLLPTRPVPLVDLSDSPFPFSSHPPVPLNTHEDDDDAWKWFGPSTPSHVRIYTPQPAPRPMSVQAWNAGAWAPQVPMSLPVPGLLQKEMGKEERLVDVDGPSGDEIKQAHMHALEWKEGRPGPLGQGIGQGFEPLDSSKTLVEFELSSYHADLKEKAYHHEDELLVDVRPTSPAPEPVKGDVHLVDSSPVVAVVGLIPSLNANSFKLQEDPFSNAYATEPVAPLVDISVREFHDDYDLGEHNDPEDEHMPHPHEDTTTLALSLSPKARPPSILAALAPAPALASKSPALAPAFVHHPLEDLVPIPAIPLSLPIDSKPLAQPLAETGIIQHDVPAEARDGGLLFSSASDETVGEEAVPPSFVMASELSLSPLVSADHDMPMIDFDLAAVQANAGAGAAWKWEDEEDPWARQVSIGGEANVEEVEENSEVEESSDADLKSLPEPQSVVLSERLEEDECPNPTLAPMSASAGAETASEEEAETTPPSPPLPLILLDTDVFDAPATPSAVAEVAEVEVDETEVGVYPDPELLPLPLSEPLPLPTLATTRPQPTIIIDNINVCMPEPDVNSKPAASQTPTPPASPPPVSPLSLRVLRSESSSPILLSPISPRPRTISPRPSRGNLRVVGERERGLRSRPVSPRVEGAGLPEDSVCAGSIPKPLWAVGTAERVVLLHEREMDVEDKEVGLVEAMKAESGADSEKGEEELEQAALPLLEKAEALADEDEPPSPLPGSFPSSSPAPVSTPTLSSTSSSSIPTTIASSSVTVTSTNAAASTPSSTTTIAARLAASAPSSLYRPSTRSIVRSPLDVALAMQLRPGLGLGADPAWMVRFLMAMWGWLAVVVSGQGGY